MRGIFLAVLFVAAGSAAGFAQEALEPVGCAHAKATWRHTLEPPPDVLGGIAFDGSPPAEDVLHYFLDIEINPSARWLGGANTMTIRSLQDGLTTFTFRLDTTFVISDVRVGGVPVTWQRTDFPAVEVTLDRAYNTGEEFELVVEYSGNPSTGGDWGSIVYTRHSGNWIVCTLSQPWYAYTWWPAKDDNVDKTTADLWFTVPNSMKVASNGLLQGTDSVPGSKLRYRWATSYPTVTYLYSFAATNYSFFEDRYYYDGGDMQLAFYIYPESNTSWNRDAWLLTKDMLAAYAPLFGEYPFVAEKYGIYQFVFNGGMEHQTMTGQGGFWEHITAHELSHQWWGDAITCASWHHIWLNEGFATYSEALWEEAKGGATALRDAMQARKPGTVTGSVYIENPTNQERIFDDALSYKKGGWVLHMLRHVVTDSVFFDILRTYRQQFEYGSATTDDFQNVAETVSGMDLDWFFEEWIYGRGAGDYEYGWRPAAVSGQDYVELYINQTQTTTSRTFVMPIDIATTSGGVETLRTIWNSARSQHFLVPVEGPVTELTFDPDGWVLNWPLNPDAISYVEGPPKIVGLTPAPNSQTFGTLSLITITFHKDVVVDAGEITLVGQAHGPMELSFGYNPTGHMVTLTAQEPLPPDEYTLTISDAVVDVAAGLALDGELFDGQNPRMEPSGDGVPAGAAVMQFTVARVAGDMDCDGVVNNADIPAFVLALTDLATYEQLYAECDAGNGDIDGDGSFNNADIPAFVALLTG